MMRVQAINEERIQRALNSVDLTKKLLEGYEKQIS